MDERVLAQLIGCIISFVLVLKGNKGLRKAKQTQVILVVAPFGAWESNLLCLTHKADFCQSSPEAQNEFTRRGSFPGPACVLTAACTAVPYQQGLSVPNDRKLLQFRR